MQSALFSYIEWFFIKLDTGPWHAVWRVVLGLCIPPALRAIPGASGSVLCAFGLFFGLLVALRVGPALLRRILPFSADAKNAWADRRQIGKQSDSYQWQKLFWIGLGMLPYALTGDEMRSGESALTLFCLISGGAGLLLWFRRSPSPSAN